MNLSYLYHLNYSLFSRLIMVWLEQEYKINKFCFKSCYFNKDTNTFILSYIFNGHNIMRFINFYRINNRFVIRTYNNYFDNKYNPFDLFDDVISVIIDNIEIRHYPITYCKRHGLNIDENSSLVFCENIMLYFNVWITQKY